MLVICYLIHFVFLFTTMLSFLCKLRQGKCVEKEIRRWTTECVWSRCELLPNEILESFIPQGNLSSYFIIYETSEKSHLREISVSNIALKCCSKQIMFYCFWL